MSKNLDSVSSERAETSEDNAKVDLAALAENDPELAQVIADLDEVELQFHHYKRFVTDGYDERDKEMYVLPDNIEQIVIGLGTIISILKLKKAELVRARKERPPVSKFERKVEGIREPFEKWMPEVISFDAL